MSARAAGTFRYWWWTTDPRTEVWRGCRIKEFPPLFLETNTGFSGAVNRGIRASDTPYVILLNNDTEPHIHYVRELLRAIERSPRIFSVSSKMIQLYNRDKMDDAGDMYSLLGWAYQRGVGQPSSGYTKPCRVFAACAGAGDLPPGAL